MTNKPLTPKKLDQKITEIHRTHCSGWQINIMDISKVFHAGKVAYAKALQDGLTPEAAIQPLTDAVVATAAALRQNS